MQKVVLSTLLDFLVTSTPPKSSPLNFTVVTNKLQHRAQRKKTQETPAFYAYHTFLMLAVRPSHTDAACIKVIVLLVNL